MRGGRAARVAAGLAASLALHGLGAGLVWLAIRPGPPEEQAPPESRLALATRDLERATAAEAEPRADAATERPAEGSGVRAGAVPRNEARPAPPPAAALAATPPPGRPVAPGAPSVAPLPADAPRPQTLATEAPVAAPALSAPLRPDTLAPSDAPGPETASARAPATETVGAQAPEPAALASRPLEAEPGRARLPRPHPAEAAAPAARPAPTEAPGADRLESEPPRLARLAAAAPAARQTRAGALPQPLPVPDTAPPAAHGDLAVPPAAAAPATAPDRVVAPPATPAAEKLASTPPGATQLDTAEPAPDPAQAGAPDTLVLVAAPARPTGLSPARPDAAPLASGALRPAALAPENPAARPTPAALPDTPHITPAAPTAAPATQGEAPTANIAPTTADPVPLAAAAPAPAPAAEGVAPVDRQRATTALDGFGDIADPVSLTAMQSFMAPETLAPEADIRDGLAGMLAGVPCARLQARFLPERGMLEVHGHVPEEDAAAPLLAALRAEMGADIPVRPNLRVLPRPQCEVLSTIAETGLPQSTDQALDARLVGEDTHVKEFTFAEGDPLVLELAAPDYDAYLYVDYFDAAGQVIHLMPNEATPLRRAEAGSLQKIGAAGPDGPGLRLLIGPPFGQEIAVAFAASTPLYEGARPMVEPAAPYLASLTRLIAQARARDPDFRGEWVYFLVVTRPS